MAHGLGQQNAEVLPLHGAGILELVDHDVLELGTDLLEDKGRVALADEGVEQLLGVAEQEAVGIGIERAHLLFDAAQEAQLVQVAQGEVGTLVELPLAGPLLDGIAKDVAQRALSEGVDERALGVGFRAPFLGVAEVIGHGGILDGRVE